MKKKMFEPKLEIQLDEDAPINVAINIIVVEYVNAGQSGFSSRRAPSPPESVLAPVHHRNEPPKVETAFRVLQQIGVVILYHSALIKLLWMRTLDSIPELSEYTVKIVRKLKKFILDYNLLRERGLLFYSEIDIGWFSKSGLPSFDKIMEEKDCVYGLLKKLKVEELNKLTGSHVLCTILGLSPDVATYMNKVTSNTQHQCDQYWVNNLFELQSNNFGSSPDTTVQTVLKNL